MSFRSAARRSTSAGPCSRRRGGPARDRPLLTAAGTGPLAGRAGVRLVAAVEIVDQRLGRESGLRIDRLQQPAELARGASPEVVRRSGDEVPALLPGARAVCLPGGEERVELRAVWWVHAVRAGRPVAERRVVLGVRGFDARQV